MASTWKGPALQQKRPNVQDHVNPLSRKDQLFSRLWSPIEATIAEMGYTKDQHGDSNTAEDTTQQELVKAIRAQTDVVKIPPRRTCIGVIDPLEGTSQTSESLPVPDLSKHLDHSELGPILEISEEVDDLLSLFEKPKVIPIKFRPSVGDVIIAAKHKKLSPELENAEPSKASTEFYPANNPSQLNGLVALYKDSFYFVDDGEYRKSVSDIYEFEQGDIVARLGHFNEHWHWIPASKFDFYLYYPKRLEGDCCKDDLGEIGPWFLLTNERKSQTGGHEPNLPPRPMPSIIPSDLLPFSTLSYPFEFRDGDILMHLTNDKTLFKPWNVGMTVLVENSKNRREPEKHLQPLDKILRYGIHVAYDVNNGRESTAVYVELYQFHSGSEWRFLGKDEGLYNHVTTLPAMIRFNVNTPQPGDIIINRRFCRPWDATEQTGGLIEIYKDESFFSLLDEPRDKFQKNICGIGSDTTIVRFGTFANKEWNWMPKPSVDIFILNARSTRSVLALFSKHVNKHKASWQSIWDHQIVSHGPCPSGISLRRHCRILWDNEWRPKANYNFSLYNPKRLREVPSHFKPRTGDIIIRYLGSNLAWVEGDQIREPSVEIEFFNAMHMAGNMLQNGNWMLRVGYELSDKNRYCTDVTAELYRYVVDPKNHKNKYWEFKGRDTCVFGALEWPQKHGLFSGKEFDQPYADPNNDVERGESSIAKIEADHSRAVHQFISGLGFQDMAYPLRDPWWYKITDVPVHHIDKD